MQFLGIAAVTTIVSFFSVARQVAAQQKSTHGLLKSLKANGFNVRQTFDGTKNELNPANIAYVEPTYLVDLGIKLVDWQPFAGGVVHSVVVSPVLLEWHRTNSPKKVNTTSGKIGIEYAYGNLQLFDFSGTPVQQAGSGNMLCGPLFALKAGVKRDELLNTWSNEASINLTVVSNKPRWPNAKNLNRQGRETYLWSPSVGVELYENATVRNPEEVKGVDIILVRGRLYIIIYPWNNNGNRHNEISVQYTHRWCTGGQSIINDNHYLTGQITRYLDKERRVGIGLGYDHGRDPNVQFLSVNRLSLGLKISL